MTKDSAESLNLNVANSISNQPHQFVNDGMLRIAPHMNYEDA